ncbi:MAG: 23S rRNA (adenine(2503)-C(2))-methyltransferase RlmN [Nitrospiraceae bacterium]|nr:23S rRNA (adenine(2503)-C(2))-methyltransferase RlmN [Nitrospiraceae bacterium]
MNLLDRPAALWAETFQKKGEAAYRGRQVAHWLFKRQVTDPAAMTNIPPSTRGLLENDLSLAIPALESVHQSADGTRKIALRLSDGPVIESVLIPRKDRMTLCLSTQAGCGIGCRFCRTAAMGLIRNLMPSEILGQWVQAMRYLSASPGEMKEGPVINHIVFMGMGEPLANLDALVPAIRSLTHPDGVGLSPRRITVSTSGLVPKMALLGEANLGIQLAVSLCAPDDILRREIMPVGRIYSIAEILDACRSFPLRNRERVTFEYVLLRGKNDAPEQARALGRLLAPFRSKVNLIAFNPFPGSPFERPEEERIKSFADILSGFHITATVRKSMGPDVLAACGQLARDRDPDTLKTIPRETVS